MPLQKYNQMILRRWITASITCFVLITVRAQSIDSSANKLMQSINNISDKSLHLMNNHYALFQKIMDKQTEKALAQMQKKEEKLQKKLQGIDSAKSKQLFAETKTKYEQLEYQLQSKSIVNNNLANRIRSYTPHLDSLQTALRFLQQKRFNFSNSKLQQIKLLSTQLQQLQSKLQTAGQVQSFLKQREQQLTQQLSNLPVRKELLSINKEAYYYQQRITEYKATLKDRDKQKQLLLQAVTAQTAFKKFWRKNSLLASLFPLEISTNMNSDSLLKGLQSRGQIGRLINEKTGKGISQNSSKSVQASGSNYLSQQVRQAKSELDILKQKIKNIGGGNSSVIIPDFTPNSQKTKTFLKRLEYGFNMQNTPSSNWLPATSNIAVTLGYKFTDKLVAGTGVGYLLGWGIPIKDIHFSNQGLNIRSFVDIKAKGSLWITGGLEYNYIHALAGIRDIRNIDIWQKSGLVGLTKKIKAGKATNLQLFYDLLARQHRPVTQPVIFRVGYQF